MSWHATLYQEFGPELWDGGYTHNTNGMVNAVLDENYEQVSVFEEVFTKREGWDPWWKRLNGMDGPASHIYLTRIIKGLEGDPEKFRAMNPDNGWGSYAGLLKQLRAMRDAIPEARVRWETRG